VKYPTVSDLLFDNKGRIKPRNAEEAAVISDMNSLKESGMITEADLNRLERAWESAKKSDRRTKKNESEIIIPNINNDDENKGDSNETL
jgi:hypothetical protein